VHAVDILKPKGRRRQLGIPCVVDRLILQALLQQLMPIFDPLFSADVVIRIGPMKASSLVQRRLGESRMIAVASPGYIAGVSRCPSKAARVFAPRPV